MVGAQLPWTDERLPMQFNHTYNYTRDQEPTRPPNPEIDGLLDKILGTPDPYERQALVFDVTRKILDRQQGYLFNGTRYGARWDYVRGYENKGFQERLLVHDMWWTSRKLDTIVGALPCPTFTFS
jgi:ABC-type transport system substrate-binding protein